MKILNLYCGIGGNRRLWGDGNEITAIELDKEKAEVYKHYFPYDKLIVCDAHEYLLNNFSEFDFIWSSPPCQSHSSMRHNLAVRYRGTKPVYPDMQLYQEILLLKHTFKGLWCVENVKPYYSPLIDPDFILQRHYFWSNFPVKDAEFKNEKLRAAQIPELEKLHGYDLSSFKLKDKRQVLRNCVLPELGVYILNESRKVNK